jgi:hypothetical protein
LYDHDGKVNIKMNKHSEGSSFPRRGFTQICSLVLCLAALQSQPSQGQAPLPVTSPTQDAPVLLPDPFFEALEGLSKKYRVAFVAEGRPFPQTRGAVAAKAEAEPAPDEAPPPVEKEKEAAPPADAASPAEKEIQRIAARFDYTAVRVGNVYLLTKRYTNPEDMPDVTPEECYSRVGADRNRPTKPNGTPYANTSKQISSLISSLFTPQGFGPGVYYGSTRVNGGAWRANGGYYGWNGYVTNTVLTMSHMFYFQAQSDRVAATRALLEDSRPADLIFRWQTIGKSPVFGYDFQFNSQDNVRFFPVSDLDRINVAPYGTPLPRPGYVLRTEMILPDPDPTDPAGLSEATKRFLDDKGRSSHAITLAEAVAALKGRAAKYVVYKVDRMYAAKHVTLVGTDKLPAETVMQALAAVYGLGVNHYTDSSVVLSGGGRGFQLPFPPAYYIYRLWGAQIRSTLTAPVYAAMEARLQGGSTKVRTVEGPGARMGEPGYAYQTQYEYQRMAAAVRNSALRQFRYIAEQQVKAQPTKRLALSRLDERARSLFAFAQTASVYAGYCEQADVPLPPFVTHIDDFLTNVAILRDTYQRPDGTRWVWISVTYVDQQTGASYGPVRIVDVPANF